MFFYKKVALLFFCCFLLLVNFHKAFAETEIYNGAILEDTVWDKSGSPYIIYDSIDVDQGVTLTIEPGVIIKMDWWKSITILGNLIVNGSTDEKVYFTSIYNDSIGGDSNNDDGLYEPDYSDWGGIFFGRNSSYNISNTEFSYAEYSLSSSFSTGLVDSVLFTHNFFGPNLSNGKVEIKNSNFKDVLGGRETNDNAFFFLWGNGNVTLDNIVVEDSPFATIAVAYSKSNLKILNSKFCNIRGGVDSYLNSSVSISNSVFENLQSKIRAIFPVQYNSTMDISSSTIDGVYNNSKYQSIFQVSYGSSLNFTDSSVKNIKGSLCSIAFEAFGSEKQYSTSTLNIKNSSMSDGDCIGIKTYGKAESNIENTKINNFMAEGLLVASSSKTIVSDSEISDNNYGIKSSGASIEIKNSSVQNNESFGIFNDSKDNSSIVEAVGNWWGNKTGPYNDLLNASGTANKVSSNVNFTPWLEYNPIAGEKRNPVIIIPGILSSYLNKNDDKKTEVWMNLLKAMIPGPDVYLDSLIMTAFGKIDINKTEIFPTDIFRKVEIANLLDKDFFDGLIKSLESDGYIEGKDLFVFPYDWRLDIRDSVNNTPSPLEISLKDKIDQILYTTSSEKLDIIAHSMGGLLSKYYLKNFGQGKVGKFIDIATPHFGAPSAFGTLISGDNLGIKLGPLGLNQNEVKKIVQNMPSAYQLLPSQSYFSDNLPDYKYYIDDLEDYDSNDVRGRLSFEESNNFLKNTGRNSYVLDNSIGIHDDIDSMNPADYGAEVYNIVGCGIPTIGKFFTLGKQNDKDLEFDIAYISGDGTVPQRSAEGILSTKQYYVTGFEHPMIPSSLGVNNLVPLILSGRQDSFDFKSYKNISTTTGECGLPNGSFLSFHNPVDVNIYDKSGNHTGPDSNGDLEESISSIIYNIIENNKFVFLPDGQDYQIKLQATALGSFSSYIKKIENGEVVSTSYFNNIPLISTSTKAEIKITGSNPEIILDSKGDGTIGEVFQPSSILVGDSLNDRNTPTTELKVISPTPSIDGSYSGNVVINFNATDTESGLLKIEYSINEGNYTEATSTINILDRGEVKISYRSVDKAGNIENPQEIILNIKDISKKSHGRRNIIKSDLETIEASTSTSTLTKISEPTILVVGESNIANQDISNSNIVSTSTEKMIVVNTKPALLSKTTKVSVKSKALSQIPKTETKLSSTKNIQTATVLLSSQNYKNSFLIDLFTKVKVFFVSFSKKLLKI